MNIEWFKVYDLEREHIILVGIITAIICCITVVIAKLMDYEPKKIAWAISLINSATMCVIGFTYVLVKLYLRGFTLVWTIDDFLGIDNIAVICCTIFGVANVFDLLLGLIFYPKYLALLTAWVHHLVYIWLMIYCTTGNGIFVSHKPFAQGFMWNIIEELPTFFLSLGSMEPSMRSDAGFGSSFFVLRIVYHALLTIYAVTSTAYGISVIVVYFLTLGLHIHWFTNWFAKYGKVLLSNNRDKQT
mmetsp:Transcript_35610/g.36320  ORF Transcript_35610/g.36320 Transcript_35610/m.36320 type:complete len:244 (+) Transcript_35610:88-819(+)